MTTANLVYFLGASAALALAPGPDILFVISQGMTRGRRAALFTCWGMCSGVTVHTLAAALGASAIFYSSALAFEIVKYAGAAYLLYIAWGTLREQAVRLDTATPRPAQPAWACFRRGFVMNVLNPKVALFFLAFLPQFVVRYAGSVAMQMVVLGLLFMLVSLVVFTGVAIGSGTLGEWLNKRPAVARGMFWIMAGVLASLAIKLALAQR